jgi:hypothetical protein
LLWSNFCMHNRAVFWVIITIDVAVDSGNPGTKLECLILALRWILWPRQVSLGW